MLGIDSLIVIGLSTLNIGTIYEADGVVSRSFCLRNDGSDPITLVQGYTSCGCTTIDFSKEQPIAAGDSTMVSLHFNPRGKGGSFYESGTVVYTVEGERRFVQMALEGECITSAETLLKQFPIQIADGLRQSTNHFDLGYMSVGQSRTLYTTVLHQDEGNRQEMLSVVFSVSKDTPKGLQHITRDIKIMHNDKEYTINISFDVVVR